MPLANGQSYGPNSIPSHIQHGVRLLPPTHHLTGSHVPLQQTPQSQPQAQSQQQPQQHVMNNSASHLHNHNHNHQLQHRISTGQIIAQQPIYGQHGQQVGVIQQNGMNGSAGPLQQHHSAPQLVRGPMTGSLPRPSRLHLNHGQVHPTQVGPYPMQMQYHSPQTHYPPNMKPQVIPQQPPPNQQVVHVQYHHQPSQPHHMPGVVSNGRVQSHSPVHPQINFSTHPQVVHHQQQQAFPQSQTQLQPHQQSNNMPTNCNPPPQVPTNGQFSQQQVDLHRKRVANGVKELDLLRCLLRDKEREMSAALARVDALTSQLDDIRKGNTSNSYLLGDMSHLAGDPSDDAEAENDPALDKTTAAMELERLKAELLYRTEMTRRQSEEICESKKVLSQKEREAAAVDKRIADLQNRLKRKRAINEHQNAALRVIMDAATMKNGSPTNSNNQATSLFMNGSSGQNGSVNSSDGSQTNSQDTAADSLESTHILLNGNTHGTLPNLWKRNASLRDAIIKEEIIHNNKTQTESDVILPQKYATLGRNMKVQSEVFANNNRNANSSPLATSLPPKRVISCTNNTLHQLNHNHISPDKDSTVTSKIEVHLKQQSDIRDKTSSLHHQQDNNKLDSFKDNGIHSESESHSTTISPQSDSPPLSDSLHLTSPPPPQIPLICPKSSPVSQTTISSSVLLSNSNNNATPPTPKKVENNNTSMTHQPATGTNNTGKAPKISMNPAGGDESSVSGSSRTGSEMDLTVDSENVAPPTLNPPPPPPPPMPPTSYHYNKDSQQPTATTNITTKPKVIDNDLKKSPTGNCTNDMNEDWQKDKRKPFAALYNNDQLDQFLEKQEQDIAAVTDDDKIRMTSVSGTPSSGAGGNLVGRMKSLFESQTAQQQQNAQQATGGARFKNISQTPPRTTNIIRGLDKVSIQLQQQSSDSNNVTANHDAVSNESNNNNGKTQDETDRSVTVRDASQNLSSLDYGLVPPSPRAQQFFAVGRAPDELKKRILNSCISGRRQRESLELSREMELSLPTSYQLNSSDKQHPEDRQLVSILSDGHKSNSSAKLPPSLVRRVSFDPLALLLDAALEGELELVQKTVAQVPNPSAATDEGITALHNAICAGHLDIVEYLVKVGCDINAQDSDGWTPLHCAASCNKLPMAKFLIRHGACVFATTLSDHETAAEKCEEDDEGYEECHKYLVSMQEKTGVLNSGYVYALYDYESTNDDELNFRDGDRLQILRRGDDQERDWWWACEPITGREGYVAKNLIGLYPRVKPNSNPAINQHHNNSSSLNKSSASHHSDMDTTDSNHHIYQNQHYGHQLHQMQYQQNCSSNDSSTMSTLSSDGINII